MFENKAFVLFIIGVVLVAFAIWLYKKIAPVIYWLYKVDNYYKYFQAVTGISRIQAVLKIATFVYRQAHLDALNRKLENQNARLQKRIDTLKEKLRQEKLHHLNDRLD